jgi:hypothetical protein
MSVAILTVLSSWLFAAGNSGMPPRETCELSGVVYVAESPQEADFLVYVKESETAAHLLVFSEVNQLMADRPGIWYFTDKPAFANFSVYFTPTPKKADFFIAYTNEPAFAGCR